MYVFKDVVMYIYSTVLWRACGLSPVLRMWVYDHVYLCMHVCMHACMHVCTYRYTGWRRLIGSPKSQIIFHKRATKYRLLLRKMPYQDKGAYGSSPPCSTVLWKGV